MRSGKGNRRQITVYLAVFCLVLLAVITAAGQLWAERAQAVDFPGKYSSLYSISVWDRLDGA